MVDPRDAAKPAQEVTNEEVAWRVTGPVVYTAPLVLQAGERLVVDGDLSIGTSGTPIASDVILLDVKEGAQLVVGGSLEIHRNVLATTTLFSIKDGKLSVSGTLVATHAGGGVNAAVEMQDGADVVVDGLTTITTDATGGASAALQGNAKAGAVFTGGLTVVATGAEVKPLNLYGDINVVVGDLIAATGNLTITRSGAGNVWTQNVIAAGSKLIVAGDLTLTANAITANEVLFFVEAAELTCMGDVTLNATSLADGALHLYKGASFKSVHNIKTLSISLGATAVEAIRVMSGSAFVVANDVILEGSAAAVMVNNGSTMDISGDLLLGNTTEQSGDITCLSVLGGGELTVSGALTVKRNVACSIPLMTTDNGRVSVTGAATFSHAGGGAAFTFYVTGASDLHFGSSYTLDTNVTGALAGGIWAEGGFNRFEVYGDMAVTLTGDQGHPIALFKTALVVGQYSGGTGTLAVTWTGTTTNNFGILYMGSNSSLWVRGNGTTTITANNHTAQPCIGLYAQSDVQIGGTLDISMTSQTSAALIGVKTQSRLEVFNIGTFAAGAMTVAGININEEGSLSVQGACDLTGSAASIKVFKNAHAFFEAASFGTVGTPLSVDVPAIEVLEGSEMYAGGNLAVYRDVATVLTTDLIHVSGAGGSLEVRGTFIVDEDSNTGEAVTFKAENGCVVNFQDTTSFTSGAEGYVIHLTGGTVANFVGHYTLSQDSSFSAYCGLKAESGAQALFYGNFISTIATGSSPNDGGHAHAEEGGQIRIVNDTTVTLTSTGLDLPVMWAEGAGSIVEVSRYATMTVDGGGGGNAACFRVTYGGVVSILCAIPTLNWQSTGGPAFQAFYDGIITVNRVGQTTFDVTNTGDSPIFASDRGKIIFLGHVDMNHVSGDEPDIYVEQGGVVHCVWTSMTITGSAALTGSQVKVLAGGKLIIGGSLTFNEGTLEIGDAAEVFVGGNLTVGDGVTAVTNDVATVSLDDNSELVVLGSVTSYRNVSSANPMFSVAGHSNMNVAGACDISRAGVGAGGVIDVDEESSFLARGTTDLLAHGGAIAADGSFLKANNLSNATFNQVLFATGVDLDLDAYASVLLEKGSKLVVTDAAGASDARNSDDVAGALGIKLIGGSQAHLPAWAQNAGISVTGAGASEDYSCGATADADYGGSEIIADVGEFCLLNKP